jgi:hypothetical protein
LQGILKMKLRFLTTIALLLGLAAAQAAPLTPDQLEIVDGDTIRLGKPSG